MESRELRFNCVSQQESTVVTFISRGLSGRKLGYEGNEMDGQYGKDGIKGPHGR